MLPADLCYCDLCEVDIEDARYIIIFCSIVKNCWHMFDSVCQMSFNPQSLLDLIQQMPQVERQEFKHCWHVLCGNSG